MLSTQVGPDFQPEELERLGLSGDCDKSPSKELKDSNEAEKKNNCDSKDLKLGRADFEIGMLLGEGAYARVFHARHRSTNKEFAIKMLDKKFLLRHGKEQQVINEKKVLSMIDHPNLVKLFTTFQDSCSLYFVLELCPGGELFQQVKKIGGCPLEVARFYMAEVVNALEYLHSHHIIHRDVKPENLLLTADGHVKLTDFGTAKIVQNVEEKGDKNNVTGSPEMGRGRKNSFVGTAEYVCPELLKGNSAGFSADLWSLGCVLFTLLSGKFPFRGASEYLTFQKILNREFEFPENFPEVARDLVNALLQMNPEDRLGAGAGGFADLKQHEFFKGIDFAHIHEQLAPAFEDILSSNSEERRLQSTVIATDLEAEVLEIKEVNKSSNLFSSRGDEWQAFLLPNEEIVKSGFVTKRRGLFSKTRMLILTNQPRFVYIDASKMEKRGEISWSSSLYAELKNERTFYVHTPKRSYYFQSLDSTARFWVEQVSKIMKNREKHVS